MSEAHDPEQWWDPDEDHGRDLRPAPPRLPPHRGRTHGHSSVKEYSPMSEYSTNQRAEDLMGRRLTPEEEESGVLAIDLPVELGFQCPIHKRTMEDDPEHPVLLWSEYNGFVWCPECDRDWPSALCVPIDAEPDPERDWVNAGPDMAIGVYLDTVADASNRALYMAAHEQP